MYSDEEDYSSENKHFEEKAVPLCLYNEKVKSKYSSLKTSSYSPIFLTFPLQNLKFKKKPLNSFEAWKAPWEL